MMKIDLGTIIVLALIWFGTLLFWVTVPTNNTEILKMIVTAFVAFVSGAAVGISINKGAKNEKTNVDSTVNIPG